MNVRRQGAALAFLLFALCFNSRLQAQDSTFSSRNQLFVVSENDNYTLKYLDHYYTNGLMIRFAHTQPSRPGAKVQTRIWNAELGHKIFTPYDIGRNWRSTLDRPYTGFLYAKGGLTLVARRENVWKLSLLTGVIGADARGEQVQTTYHKDLGLVEPHGWETQLASEVGANLQASYYQHLTKPRAGKRTFDAFLKGNVLAGTLFDQASAGFLFRLGLMKAPGESTWWEAGSARNNKLPALGRNEVFFYFEPSLTYQAYNATVQGGMFTRDKDVFTTEIQPFMYTHNFGLMFTARHWKGQLGFTYKTKEARTMVSHENYGTIGIGYLF